MSRKPLERAVLTYLAEQYDVVTADRARLSRRDIHRTRVATRRYRSVLRVFAPLFDDARAGYLDAELAWYAGLLGAVRDTHVMRTHLRDVFGALPDEVDVHALEERADRTLRTRERSARSSLDRARRSQRMARLRAELDVWAADPPLVEGGDADHDLPGYLDKTASTAARRLRKARKRADADPGKDAALHRARKAAKRARYVAELGAPTLGKPARKAAKRWRRVQDDLGRHQDGALTAVFLRELVEDDADFALGVLWAHERLR